MMAPNICIIGAGAIGLSCAIRVKEVLGVRVDVTIIADKFGKETTSHVAAGVFRIESAPPISGYTGKRTDVSKDVARLSFNHYYTLSSSSDHVKAGIHRIDGYTVRYPSVPNPPTPSLYMELARNWHPASEEELLSNFPALPKECTGDFMETMMASPRTYMPWLMQRFVGMGGKVKEARVSSFDELWAEYDIIFNCTGLGAQYLTSDSSMYSVRGQVIRALLPASTNKFCFIHDGTDKPAYFFWTPDGTVLGGVKLVNDSNTAVSQEHHDLIMNKNCKMFPHLNITEENVIEESVGLRPYRPTIRLEKEEHSYRGTRKWVIHNYGHGSHGIALSFGSACIAVELLTDIIYSSKL